MNRKEIIKIIKIISIILILFISVSIIIVPFTTPFHRKVVFITEDESKLRLSVKFDEYSNDILIENNANISLKLVRIGEQTQKINVTNVYLHTFMFFENNASINYLLDEDNREVKFQIPFIYSLTWGTVNLTLKVDYSSDLDNGTNINGNTGYLHFLKLLPNPDFRLFRNGFIGGVPIGILVVIALRNLLRRRKMKMKSI